MGYIKTGYNPGYLITSTYHHYFTPSVNFLFGGQSHYCEVGAAFMLDFFYDKTVTSILIPSGYHYQHDKGSFLFHIAPSPHIGYRYQPQQGGFLFRIAYTPLFTEWYLWHYWCGISFGYTF
jgi:hypothetical protein